MPPEVLHWINEDSEILGAGNGYLKVWEEDLP